MAIQVQTSYGILPATQTVKRAPHSIFLSSSYKFRTFARFKDTEDTSLCGDSPPSFRTTCRDVWHGTFLPRAMAFSSHRLMDSSQDDVTGNRWPSNGYVDPCKLAKHAGPCHVFKLLYYWQFDKGTETNHRIRQCAPFSR